MNEEKVIKEAIKEALENCPLIIFLPDQTKDNFTTEEKQLLFEGLVALKNEAFVKMHNDDGTLFRFEVEEAHAKYRAAKTLMMRLRKEIQDERKE